MRRITAWITAVVTVAALWLSHEANQSGVTGKTGDNGAGTEHTGKAGERK